MIWQIIFLLCLFLLFHTYILYPLIITVKASGKKQNDIVFQKDDEGLPNVSVLVAAYNEEKVIRQKILSTFEGSYPAHKIEMIIGSDASSDQTDSLVEELTHYFPSLKLIRFPGRTGKAGIINQIQKQAQHPVIILTDANVIFNTDTIYEMIKHFRNERIKLVGGNIVNSRFREDGISVQEETYITRENRIKYREGILWGAMIGAFGGCYALRKEYYAEVPPRFFMDDFYITMNVIERGGLAINELNAVCYEDVSNRIREEFRRKVRISIGNFQNLSRYWKMLLPPWKGIAFSFLSHKVLRWFGPFFLIFLFVSNLLLYPQNLFYQITLWGQLFLLFLPLPDLILRRMNININLLRFITHFYFMNFALLIGFLKFVKGVKTNIWQPTQRFQ